MLIEVLGTATTAGRLTLGRSITDATCEILGDLDRRFASGEGSVWVPEGTFYGKWNYYLRVSCDPNKNREENIEEMAEGILDEAKKYTKGFIGVWLDIGTKRFWVSGHSV